MGVAPNFGARHSHWTHRGGHTLRYHRDLCFAETGLILGSVVHRSFRQVDYQHLALLLTTAHAGSSRRAFFRYVNRYARL